MSAALDASARALARRLLREHPASRPYARADLDALPDPVARLLAADLDRHVERAVPGAPWVDPSAPAVRDAVRQWREAAREAARIPADAWAGAVERAAHLALSHLVRPAETLAAYAFEGEEGPLPAAQALRRVEAFGPYPYLPDIAARYVERKDLGQIDRPGLERLLRRIDQRMVSSFGTRDWAGVFAPLFDLAGPDGAPRGTVPAALLRELAEAKDAPALAAALDTPLPLSADDLRQRLADALGEPPPAPPAETAPAPLLPEPAEAEDEAPEDEPSEDEARVDPSVTDDGDPVAQDAPPPPSLPDVPATSSVPDEPTALRAPEAPPARPADEPRPEAPVIGSQYRPPAEAPALDSDVIGGPRPAAPRAEPETEPEPSGFVFGGPAEDEPAEHEPPVPPAPEPPPPPVAPTAPTSDAVDEDEPLWRRFARDPETAPAHEASATEDETPLWQRFLQDDPSGAPADEPEPPLPSDALGTLEGRVLGSNPDERRDWFVDELFGGSPADYHRTLAALDDARTWTEATQIIGRDVFRKHSVNIYSEPAVAFTDAVEARMTARGKG